MRQPQVRNCSSDMVERTMNSTPVARIMPSGTPICGAEPNRPRLPWGACSTDSSAAPPHSPPADRPCSSRSATSRIGAHTPIWA